MFFVTLLNQVYWVCGSTFGGLLGSLVEFNTKGLDFVMTALFIVIFLEQWMKEKTHHSAILGLGISLLCLIIFGGENFIIPAMLLILASLTVLRRPLEKAREGEQR
jgi:4-azaleucine resistance transporter AzlC